MISYEIIKKKIRFIDTLTFFVATSLWSHYGLKALAIPQLEDYQPPENVQVSLIPYIELTI